MSFDFDTIYDRRETASLKWQRYAGRDILPLWVADMDFAAPPCVLAAIQRRLLHPVLGYSTAPASATASVVEYLARQHGVAADPSWIVWLPGLVPAKSMACRATGAPGDSVITLTPIYPPFLHVHKDAEKQLITVPLAQDTPDGVWRIDFAALETAVTPSTRVFLFCNPHNPVGRVYTRAEVQGVIDFCLRHDLLLCSDEIHCDLVLDALRHESALGFAGAIQERLIVLMAASKTYNIPGLALAWAVIPDARLRTAFRAAGGKLIPELNPLSYAATEAALREGEPWRQALLAYLRGLRLAQPLQATYLAWLDARSLSVAHPQTHFEALGVGLSPGTDFAAPDYVRLNFGCPRATLDEALRRMAGSAAQCLTDATPSHRKSGPS
jgi:cysteine-S-conjugate beta-lyase